MDVIKAKNLVELFSWNSLSLIKDFFSRSLAF